VVDYQFWSSMRKLTLQKKKKKKKTSDIGGSQK
jgi:hypothetical protein